VNSSVMRPAPGVLRFAGILCTALLPVLLGACLETTAPSPPILWQGDLIAASEELPIQGMISVLAQSFQTQMAVSVDGAETDSILGWAVRSGTCEGSGDPLGPPEAFPPIEIDEEGEGLSNALFQGRLNTTLPLSGVVLSDVSTSPEILACADLERSETN